MDTQPSTTNPSAVPPKMDPELYELVKAAKAFGRKYGSPYYDADSTFMEGVRLHYDRFTKLRGYWGGQGSRKKVTIDGSEYNWSEFCKAYLGIKPEHFSRAVKQIEDEKAAAEKAAVEAKRLAEEEARRKQAEIDNNPTAPDDPTRPSPLTALQQQAYQALLGQGYKTDIVAKAVRQAQGEDLDSLLKSAMAIASDIRGGGTGTTEEPDEEEETDEADEDAEGEEEEANAPAPGNQPDEPFVVQSKPGTPEPPKLTTEERLAYDEVLDAINAPVVQSTEPPKPEPQSKQYRLGWDDGVAEGRKRQAATPTMEMARAYFGECKDDIQEYMDEVQDMINAHGLGRKLIVLQVDEVALNEDYFKQKVEEARNRLTSH